MAGIRSDLVDVCGIRALVFPASFGERKWDIEKLDTHRHWGIFDVPLWRHELVRTRKSTRVHGSTLARPCYDLAAHEDTPISGNDPRTVRACTRKLGRTPGRGTFTKITGITGSHVAYYWPRHSDLVRDAGGKPNTLNVATSDAEIFEHYGRICLRLHKIPTSGELRIAIRELGTRSHNVFLRFGSMAELDQRFRAWLPNAANEFQEILDYDGWRSNAGSATIKAAGVSADVRLRPFLPASLLQLEQLAQGINPAPDLVDNVPHEFERRCGDAFRSLGFDVQQLGQGRGRKADFIALARRDGFAAVCDAKVRGEGYVLGTEDRKFLEYAVKQTRELQANGIRNVYLVVIGSVFRIQISTSSPNT